ncbi:kinesin-like protein KIF2A isoform X6 [Limulus polyphemus]|uniref:Kinesin-like protein KIF2A isoform X6 n=1 Tax=Limulus polyphemus TaxID=6850 RepID=A0ABM1S5D9_LIMPO|nr:kinesin-like protein KIF2A isoform X6 [Limulus polyphemus]
MNFWMHTKTLLNPLRNGFKMIELLTMANEVDYDVDAYSQQLEDLLAEKLGRLGKLKEKVKLFRQQLAEEENISRTITEDLEKYAKH